MLLVPALDLVILRLGNTPVERRPHVVGLLGQIVSLFAEA